MTPRAEFHRYRSDVLMADGVEPEAKETPDVDNREVRWCYCCHSRQPMEPEQVVCDGCAEITKPE